MHDSSDLGPTWADHCWYCEAASHLYSTHMQGRGSVLGHFAAFSCCQRFLCLLFEALLALPPLPPLLPRAEIPQEGQASNWRPPWVEFCLDLHDQATAHSRPSLGSCPALLKAFRTVINAVTILAVPATHVAGVQVSFDARNSRYSLHN